MSEALAAAGVTKAPPGPVASTMIGAGAVIVGGVVSCTVTVKELDAWLPAASCAVTLTVVVPRWNVEPDAGLAVVGTAPSTLSVAEVVKVTTAPPGPVASGVMLTGTVITGGVVSADRTGSKAPMSGGLPR